VTQIRETCEVKVRTSHVSVCLHRNFCTLGSSLTVNDGRAATYHTYECRRLLSHFNDPSRHYHERRRKQLALM